MILNFIKQITCSLTFFILFFQSDYATSCIASINPRDRVNSTLQFVYVVMRHGSRAPVITYPNDPYPNSNITFWPFGPESLTKVGRQQMLILGQQLRKNYDTFLGNQYIPSRLDIKYNNLLRLYESGGCMAAGLFPPQGQQIWDNTLLWLPVFMSAHQFELSKLAEKNGGCPAYYKESQNQLDDMDKKSEANRPLLDKISSGTGMNVTKISQIHYIYSTLLYDVNSGYKLPEWAKDIYPEQMMSFYTEYLIAKFASTDKLIKLGAGELLKDVTSAFGNRIKDKSLNAKQMHVLVTHDNTIISLLKAMGNKNPNEEIRLGAYIIYELHKVPFHGYLIRVLYYEKYNSETPKVLEVPECANLCTLDKFNKFVKSSSSSNWQRDCTH